MKPTRVAPVLQDLYRKSLPFCEKRGIALNLDISDPSISVDGSVRGLRAVLAEYLHGAIMRTRDGSITLGVRADGGQVVITVKDSGMVLSKDERRRLLAENPGLAIRARHGFGNVFSIVWAGRGQ